MSLYFVYSLENYFRCQEILAKKANPEAFVLPNTHLVCAQQQNTKKYEAAVKWNLPIVTEMWIRDCFKHGVKLPVDNYLTNNLESKSKLLRSTYFTRKNHRKFLICHFRMKTDFLK